MRKPFVGFRADQWVVAAASAKARQEGVPLSALIRRALDRELERTGP